MKVNVTSSFMFKYAFIGGWLEKSKCTQTTKPKKALFNYFSKCGLLKFLFYLKSHKVQFIAASFVFARPIVKYVSHCTLESFRYKRRNNRPPWKIYHQVTQREICYVTYKEITVIMAYFYCMALPHATRKCLTKYHYHCDISNAWFCPWLCSRDLCTTEARLAPIWISYF